MQGSPRLSLEICHTRKSVYFLRKTKMRTRLFSGFSRRASRLKRCVFAHVAPRGHSTVGVPKRCEGFVAIWLRAREEFAINRLQQPAFGELPLLWQTVITTFPLWHFNDDASTISILVDIIMLGQCMLLVLASEMVSRVPYIPGTIYTRRSSRNRNFSVKPRRRPVANPPNPNPYIDSTTVRSDNKYSSSNLLPVHFHMPIGLASILANSLALFPYILVTSIHAQSSALDIPIALTNPQLLPLHPPVS